MVIYLFRLAVALACPGLLQAFDLRYRDVGIIFLLYLGTVAFGIVSALVPGLVGVGTFVIAVVSLLGGYPISAWYAFRTRKDAAPRATWTKRFGMAGGVILAFWLLLTGATWFRANISEPYVIPTRSMMPTLMPGDRIMVDKRFSPKSNPAFAVHRGDLVAHTEEGVAYIRRIIAIPGDTIRYEAGRFFINGSRIEYSPVTQAAPECLHFENEGMKCFSETLDGVKHRVLVDLKMRAGSDQKGWEREWKIEPGYAFMVGDYRDNSYDSRSKGPIPLDSIIGRPVYVRLSWDSSAKQIRWDRFGLTLR